MLEHGLVEGARRAQRDDRLLQLRRHPRQQAGHQLALLARQLLGAGELLGVEVGAPLGRGQRTSATSPSPGPARQRPPLGGLGASPAGAAALAADQLALDHRDPPAGIQQPGGDHLAAGPMPITIASKLSAIGFLSSVDVTAGGYLARHGARTAGV